ncbi:MAG: signal recognition particle-docking protein FtsY [Candidatus Aenigmarchaeota archaeon]|nr:signal recognition particle-docking protein FtsY [Candidatus Aenigmarchaeota archaeon]
MAEEGKKKSLFSGLIKKVSEKRLEEKDVDKVARELHLTLLENDVSMETADRISEDLKKELVGKNVPRGKMEDAIKDALRNSMLDVLRQEKPDINKLIKEKRGEPFVIVFLGFNGTGKTTNLSKLASMMKEHRPVLAAADTFRAASIEQLEEHGRRLGMKVVKHTYGSDSAAVIFDAKKHAAASGSRLVLADTAGRSHANVNLMDELKKICRVNKPDMKILVLDSLTGNDIYDQVNLFNDAVGIDGIILSKADVYDKGGAALSAAHTSKKPILYLGTGQNYEDLKEFDPEEIINSLLE